LLAGISQSSFKKNTIKTYKSVLSKLTAHFGERDLNSLTPEEILSFLTDINQGTKQLTKRTRYSQLTSFFNFITQNLDPNFRSPCDPHNTSWIAPFLFHEALPKGAKFS